MANQLTALDHVSGGRAIAGLGAGWQVNEHTAYGIDLMNPHDLSDRFEESVAVISALLRDDRSDFSGRFFSLHDAPNNPKPVQPRLPILVGGGGEKRTIPTAAKYADVHHIWGTPEGYAAKSAKLDEACAAIGRDPAEIRRATGFPYPVGRKLRGGAGAVPAVCDEFVVFDWFDRPAPRGTIDDLTAALEQQIRRPLTLTRVPASMMMSTGSSCSPASATAVDGLSLTVEGAAITAVLRPEQCRQDDPRSRPCEGYRAPQQGTLRVLQPDPAARRARGCYPGSA